jgi:hypothetical protein
VLVRFQKGRDRDDIMAEVKVWVEAAVAFRPLLEGKPLSELAPTTQLERTLACLEGV